MLQIEQEEQIKQYIINIHIYYNSHRFRIYYKHTNPEFDNCHKDACAIRLKDSLV